MRQNRGFRLNYYNKSNAAYDLSRFAPAEEPEEPEIEKQQKQPAPKKRKAVKKAVKPATVVKWVFISLFCMMSLASIMVGNIKITQLNDQISKTQKALDTEKSEQVTLNSKLEARMSMSKVEDYAVNKLGLVKIQPYQIQYVHLTDKDNVVVSSGDSGISSFFKNLFNSAKEYFQ